MQSDIATIPYICLLAPTLACQTQHFTQFKGGIMSAEIVENSTAIELSEQELNSVAGGSCGGRKSRTQPIINIGIIDLDGGSQDNNTVNFNR